MLAVAQRLESSLVTRVVRVQISSANPIYMAKNKPAPVKQKWRSYRKGEGYYMPWYKLLDLKGIHTKTLMKWREAAYHIDPEDHPNAKREYTPVINNIEYPPIPLEAILEELNTRPHVLNKQEAKTLRQQKAKQSK